MSLPVLLRLLVATSVELLRLSLNLEAKFPSSDKFAKEEESAGDKTEVRSPLLALGMAARGGGADEILGEMLPLGKALDGKLLVVLGKVVPLLRIFDPVRLLWLRFGWMAICGAAVSVEGAFFFGEAVGKVGVVRVPLGIFSVLLVDGRLVEGKFKLGDVWETEGEVGVPGF